MLAPKLLPFRMLEDGDDSYHVVREAFSRSSPCAHSYGATLCEAFARRAALLAVDLPQFLHLTFQGPEPAPTKLDRSRVHHPRIRLPVWLGHTPARNLRTAPAHGTFEPAATSPQPRGLGCGNVCRQHTAAFLTNDGRPWLASRGVSPFFVSVRCRNFRSKKKAP